MFTNYLRVLIATLFLVVMVGLPVAQANPCNPCGKTATNACNPCGSKASNPCAKNACNPCGK